MRRRRTLALIALTGGGGFAGAAGTDGARAATSTGLTPALMRADHVSATRCQLELPVRISRRSFESTPGGTVSCGGVLLGHPIAAGRRARATGNVVPPHHGPLPSTLGAMQLHLPVIGPALPLTPGEYTKIRVSLAPHPAGTPAGGLYRGTASARGLALEAAGAVVLVPGAPRPGRRCCVTGRVIVDVTLSRTS